MRKLKHIECYFGEHKITLHIHRDVLAGITLNEHPGVHLSHLLRALKLVEPKDILPCSCALYVNSSFLFGRKGVLAGVTVHERNNSTEVLRMNELVVRKQDARKAKRRATNTPEM